MSCGSMLVWNLCWMASVSYRASFFSVLRFLQVQVSVHGRGRGVHVYMGCVYVCVCARVRACVRVCVYILHRLVCVWACMHVDQRNILFCDTMQLVKAIKILCNLNVSLIQGINYNGWITCIWHHHHFMLFLTRMGKNVILYQTIKYVWGFEC